MVEKQCACFVRQFCCLNQLFKISSEQNTCLPTLPGAQAVPVAGAFNLLLQSFSPSISHQSC